MKKKSIWKSNIPKFLVITLIVLCLLAQFHVLAFAATNNTDVAGSVTSAFNTYMKPQIKNMVNNVVLVVISAILLILFIVFICLSGVHYRRNRGEGFEWHIPAIFLGGLVISLTAHLWIWKIIGW